MSEEGGPTSHLLLALIKQHRRLYYRHLHVAPIDHNTPLDTVPLPFVCLLGYVPRFSFHECLFERANLAVLHRRFVIVQHGIGNHEVFILQGVALQAVVPHPGEATDDKKQSGKVQRAMSEADHAMQLLVDPEEGDRIVQHLLVALEEQNREKDGQGVADQGPHVAANVVVLVDDQADGGQHEADATQQHARYADVGGCDLFFFFFFFFLSFRFLSFRFLSFLPLSLSLFFALSLVAFLTLSRHKFIGVSLCVFLPLLS
mmetsp:Transcript_24011/g.69079  ORF Transcript_24011/g.69079 Transcript_24011/m.69079 type:complete len:259 (+) Transcript_24011:1190-1966(+)